LNASQFLFRNFNLAPFFPTTYITFALLSKKMKTVAFHTLGCKLNFAESSTMIRKFTDSGYCVIDFKETADLYVIHSCIVTQQAEHKCIASIRQAKKRNPLAKIAVIGCMPELNRARLEKEGSDLIILGNSDKFFLPEIIDTGIPLDDTKNIQFIPSYSSGSRSRTFFKIQDGCDYYCSYCTIPYARGDSRSGTIEETLQRISEATQDNCNELVLTGINLGDFGRKNHESLFGLLDALQYFKNIKRIRLSSIESNLLDDNIIDLFKDSELFMPHFHIPLQSGSDKILKLMNRRYSAQLFADKVNQIREKIPHACIATDIITGFPGEDEADFEEGYRFLEQLDISYMHVFTYSGRAFTKASEMKLVVESDIKKQRSRKLHHLSEQKKSSFYKEHYGRVCNVLFETEIQGGFISGFSDNYIRVKTKYSEGLKNSIRTIKISHLCEDGVCLAQLL
jgi:threonylcarbamoyladenosine tRNA methylthiotransferase MtaB